jgi:RHS repeat-associated protein
MKLPLIRASFVGVLALVFVVVATPAHAQSEVVEYYALDAIGSVRVVFDVNGNVIGRMDYDPFGAPLSSGNALPSRAYAGLFRDGEAGLDFAQARSYQSRTGRFSTVDPVASRILDPQAWNMYAYARNNPLTYTDATGLQPDCSDPPTSTENGIIKVGIVRCEGSKGGRAIPGRNGGSGGNGDEDELGEDPDDPVDDNDTGGPESPVLPGPSGPTPPGPTPPGPTPPGPTPPGPIGPGPNAQVAASTPPRRPFDKFVQCASDQLGLSDLFADGAVALGQPVAGSKRFVTPGSSMGTSYAGRAADWVFGGTRLPVRLPTIVGGPGTGRALAVAGTKSVARFAGRAVPIIGWGILAYDAVRITACTVG